LAGIGSRAVSSAHQHGPARAQVNSVPHLGQASRRGAGMSSRFVIDDPLHSGDGEPVVSDLVLPGHPGMTNFIS
jgi:hypothetical protein